MKRLFCLLIIIALAVPAFAEFNVSVTGHAPTSSNTTENAALQLAFNGVLTDLTNQFKETLPNSPQNLLQAMGNSSVYASHGATTRGYGGYKIFSATIGTMYGIQLPGSIASASDDLENISNIIERDGDVYLGASPNAFNVNVGLNMGIFKIEKLYLGLRVGYFKMPEGIIKDLNYQSLTLGVTANYQIIPSVSLAGFITWRGLSLGSGFIYSSSKESITIPIGDPISQTSSGITMKMNPKATVNLDITTFTIPLEAVTAIKLLIFNIPFGVGADLAFGKTSLGLGIDSDLNITGGSGTINKGDISVNVSASNSPSFFNFKFMTGLGINAGPFVFDIPITYYPGKHQGLNFGLTIGAVF
jgi:hypothetical protein